MDGVALLASARAAGLEIEPDGGQLRIKGPKTAEGLVRQLTQHKGRVLAALHAEARGAKEPTGDCHVCGGAHYWRHAEYGHWVCARCHPAPKDLFVGGELIIVEPQDDGRDEG
jgi:hypothetical protein